MTTRLLSAAASQAVYANQEFEQGRLVGKPDDDLGNLEDSKCSARIFYCIATSPTLLFTSIKKGSSVLFESCLGTF